MNTMKLPICDLSYLSVGLPDEVKMYHFSGDFAGEIAAIDRWLTRPVPVPDCLRKRLEIQRIFAVQLLDDYPLTRAEVVEGIRARYPAADETALDTFIASGNVDYILKNGEMRYTMDKEGRDHPCLWVRISNGSGAKPTFHRRRWRSWWACPDRR